LLLPVRNAVETLGSALRSIQRQTFGAWECIVVDDGSSDGSLELLRRIAKDEPRFQVLEQPPRGIVAALNAGLSRVNGRYVARMDADDVMHRERLERQVAVLDVDTRLAGVGCHVRLFPRSRVQGGLLEYERWLNSISSTDAVRREAFVECPIAHPTLLARAALLREFGYRDQGWPEDYDLVLRLLIAGHELGVVPRRLLSWRDGPLRLSRTGSAYRIEQFVACKAHFLVQSRLSNELRYVLWGYGGTGKALARALLEHGRTPSHIVEVHPGRIGQRIAGARVVAPGDLPALERRPIVVSVAGAEPRSQVRAALSAMGYTEQIDFVCAA
jgi:glycosyltransferase involved in cell wall biosynthesis